jgi:hypothetical protein
MDIRRGNKLHFLVDSGADISLIKSEKLLGTATFEPRDRVRVKSVNGSIIETHGRIETQILEAEVNIPYSFQLVSQQVDLKDDGILGRDFLKAMQARICYENKVLTFQHEGTIINKTLGSLPEPKRGVPDENRVKKINLPARTDMIVQLPVRAGSKMKEGLVEKAELASGVYLAESLVKENNGQVITSILNTRDEDVDISITELELTEQDSSNVNEVLTVGLTQRGKTQGNASLSRGEQVISRLRTDHLNKEEKRTLQEICFDYQDVFYLPGDKLSSTDAARHTIHLEPGTTPINTRPYRLPESQKNEIDRQV